MTRPDYIFIVGLGRTGSTLTRTILNSSDEIGLGGESHFFRDLPRISVQANRGFRQRVAKLGDLSTDEGAKKVVEHIFCPHQRHFNFWNLSNKSVEREEFLQ